MGAAGSKLEKALGDQFPEGERYFGLENFGNTCYCNSVLQHDRPENLKREMNVTDLQWYGYCLFKALAGLHRQGIVHRDVKPGNFLYSCKINKGYLIDFNLALVLFRSPHQGPKADIWSAGVTLLYLMIGRTPFAGDTEQNIKEIAKLRGSEDLWEVAKLHNHEI